MTAATMSGPASGRVTISQKGQAAPAVAEFLDRLADLVPPPRKHRHRSHGVTQAKPRGKAWCSHGRQQHATHELLISRAMREEVPSAGL